MRTREIVGHHGDQRVEIADSVRQSLHHGRDAEPVVVVSALLTRPERRKTRPLRFDQPPVARKPCGAEHLGVRLGRPIKTFELAGDLRAEEPLGEGLHVGIGDPTRSQVQVAQTGDRDRQAPVGVIDAPEVAQVRNRVQPVTLPPDLESRIAQIEDESLRNILRDAASFNLGLAWERDPPAK